MRAVCLGTTTRIIDFVIANSNKSEAHMKVSCELLFFRKRFLCAVPSLRGPEGAAAIRTSWLILRLVLSIELRVRSAFFARRKESSKETRKGGISNFPPLTLLEATKRREHPSLGFFLLCKSESVFSDCIRNSRTKEGMRQA